MKQNPNQKQNQNQNFGINVKKWCRDHEAAVTSQSPTPELLEDHERKIRYLQHERLIHLIVTFLVCIVELFALDLVILHPELGIYPAIFMLGLAILLIFYFYHYFFLENTVQRWYIISDKMKDDLKEDVLKENALKEDASKVTEQKEN